MNKKSEIMYADETTADVIKIAEGALGTHGQAEQAQCSNGLVRALIDRLVQEQERAAEAWKIATKNADSLQTEERVVVEQFSENVDLRAEVKRYRAELEVFLAPAIVFAIPHSGVRDKLQSQVRAALDAGESSEGKS